jgi:hypothetical protein
LKHVFPVLPVLSRSELGLDKLGDGMPEAQTLDKIPAHLLAAIYASALPFAPEDRYLSLATSHDESPAPRLWCLVHKTLVESTHAPRLSLLQAAILYLHRHIRDEHCYAVVDTASLWCLMGMAVGLASSLGLSHECRLFGLPAAEKRIRRRLWWALYVEDKWMALMLGRPPYIRSSEWDVDELDDGDFIITSQPGPSSASGTLPFRYMASLAIIADSVQDKL